MKSGIIKVGFTLAEHQLLNETLVIRWKPPQSVNKEIGNAEIGVKNDSAYSLKLYNPAGKLFFHLTYNDFIKRESCSFPGKVTLFMDLDNEITSEELVYSNPVFNEKLPEEIGNFSLPANIKIKELLW